MGRDCAPVSHPRTFCYCVVGFCASVDCRNGGTCVDSHDGFTCQCRDDFTGEYCTQARNKGSVHFCRLAVALLHLYWFRCIFCLVTLLLETPGDRVFLVMCVFCVVINIMDKRLQLTSQEPFSLLAWDYAVKFAKWLHPKLGRGLLCLAPLVSYLLSE